jgi:hypothetical protein
MDVSRLFDDAKCRMRESIASRQASDGVINLSQDATDVLRFAPHGLKRCRRNWSQHEFTECLDSPGLFENRQYIPEDDASLSMARLLINLGRKPIGC